MFTPLLFYSFLSAGCLSFFWLTLCWVFCQSGGVKLCAVPLSQHSWFLVSLLLCAGLLPSITIVPASNSSRFYLVFQFNFLVVNIRYCAISVRIWCTMMPYCAVTHWQWLLIISCEVGARLCLWVPQAQTYFMGISNMPCHRQTFLPCSRLNITAGLSSAVPINPIQNSTQYGGYRRVDCSFSS